ncbi:MAG: hypothetical protein HY904_12870 [Deltaproteobacteria bacterium]|nr:hypothetical protein [Deltaproteobacteria bacterium]
MTTRLFTAGFLGCLLAVGAADAAPKKPPPPPPAKRPAAPAPARPAPPPSAPEAAAPAPAGPRAGAGGSPASRKTAAEAQDSAVDAAAAARKGPTRVDFDDRLVQGQSTKQGAIYLFERKESALRSMLRKRESFRSEISGSIQ